MAAPYSASWGKLYIGLDQIGYINSYSYSQTNDLLEKTALGDTAKSFLTGLADGTVTVEFWYDPANTQQAQLRPASGSTINLGISFESGATQPVVSGLVAVESFEINASQGSLVTGSITARGFINGL